MRSIEEVSEELQGMETAQPGWFAFFCDPDDVDCPYWAEPIVGWGRYMCRYFGDEGDLNGVEVRAMKVEGDVGVLDSSFLDAPNFIGIFYSKKLLESQEHDIIFYEAICGSDQKLMSRIDGMMQSRADHQVMGTQDYSQTDEEQEENLN